MDHVTAQGIVHSIDRGHHFGNESGHLLWQKHTGNKDQRLCSSVWSHLVTPALLLPPKATNHCHQLDSTTSKSSPTCCQMMRGNTQLPGQSLSPWAQRACSPSGYLSLVSHMRLRQRQAAASGGLGDKQIPSASSVFKEREKERLSLGSKARKRDG